MRPVFSERWDEGLVFGWPETVASKSSVIELGQSKKVDSTHKNNMTSSRLPLSQDLCLCSNQRMLTKPGAARHAVPAVISSTAIAVEAAIQAAAAVAAAAITATVTHSVQKDVGNGTV
jgi:hypothetical protein